MINEGPREERPLAMLAMLPFLLIGIGLVLALGQFLHNRSLWVDEIFLAMNIIDRSIPQLMTPLDNSQVAPFLFLALEKILYTLLPATDHGLRILPMLCYVISSLAFLDIVRRLFVDLATQVFAVTLFVFNVNLIYYASEVKQYMGDVAVGTVVGLLFIRYSTNGRGLHALGAFAVAAIWFSSITPIVVVPVLLHLLVQNYRKGSRSSSTWKHLISWTALWCLSFLIYYAVAVHDHPATDVMQRFWTAQQGLLPNDFFSGALYGALYGRVLMVLNHLLPYEAISFYVLSPLLIIGSISSLRAARVPMLVLGCLPVLLHLLLATLHLYPFDTRLILYLVPAFIIIGALGFQICLRFLSGDLGKTLRLLMTLSVPLLIAMIFMRKDYPIERQEIRSCMDLLLVNASADDRVFVDIDARIAYNYYRRTGKYDTVRIVLLGSGPDDPEGQLSNAIDRRSPIGFVLTSQRKPETDAIISQLNSFGYRLALEHHASGAHAYRYLAH